MFVDELTIRAKAGDGGDGVVRWLRERHRPKGGPAGGNGGDGGDVYVRAVRDANILSKYTGEKVFAAGKGAAGGGRSRAGGRGADCVIDLPVGSKVTELRRNLVYTLEKEGEIVRVLKGGQGGLGNEHFKSSTNRSPRQSTKGTKGESADLFIEVTLIADVGIIGLPNAGKSTLLNALTNATSAVGAYPFTTLEPHLGAFYGYVLADVPGLIEGASLGKGLGHKFLRHIGRTKMLLHCISLEDESATLAYENVQKELRQFDTKLAEKETWLVLTKRDLVSQSDAQSKKVEAQRHGRNVFIISAETGEGLKDLSDSLIAELRNANRPEEGKNKDK